ncbi:MAG: RNA methyltransferase [Bacteroidetes bacterium]|nr:RNA methyltransferase [Bacteroidota bacterium]MBS1650017.1 RNA methyltransferase [Bacteroidota bacterium]
MLSKNEVKYIQSLCHKKQRNETGLFIAEGPKLAEEILASSYIIEKVYALPEWIEKNNKINAVEITQKELNQISQLQTPNEVVLIVKQAGIGIEPILKNNFTVVLDDIQDPGNLGTIIRLCDWFGVQQIICSNNTVELYNSKVIQSTMGSFVNVKIWYKNLIDFFNSNKNIPVWGAVLNGMNVYELVKPKEAILLIGNEGKGINNNLLSFIHKKVTIPKKGKAESLNAAVATGILLSHLT